MAAPPATATASPSLQGSTLLDGLGHSVDVGCQGRFVLAEGERFYVACGAEGVAVVARKGEALIVTGRIATAGEAVALFVRGNLVWVETLRASAEPLNGAIAVRTSPEPSAQPVRPSPAPGEVKPEPATSEQTALPIGKIIESRADGFVIDLGKVDGIKVGDRIEAFLIKHEVVAGQDMDMAETQVIGEAIAVSDHRTRVELGMNERVSPEASARPTKRRVTANLAVPPRAAPMTQVEAGVTPFLPVGDLGIGLLGRATVTYHLDSPWMLGATIAPFGVSIGQGDKVGLFSAHAFAAFEHQSFALGLTLGEAHAQRQSNSGADELIPSFALGTLVRFGALDGMHIAAHTQFALVDKPLPSNAKEFDFASMSARLQIPFARSAWGVARTEFDQMHFNGAVGLKLLLIGPGGPGSFFLTPQIGGAFVYGGGDDRGGPSIGADLEWRL